MKCFPLFSLLLASTVLAKPSLPSPPGSAPSGIAPAQFATTPTRDNDTSLRALSPEEIPPNLNFYSVNPLYKEGASLGWAKERIEEKLDRGVVTRLTDDQTVYVSWRLLKSDPVDIAFNVYRTAGGVTTRLNRIPLIRTTDYIDSFSPGTHEVTWAARAVVNGRELELSPVVGVPGGAVANYRALKLKPEVTSLSAVGIGDLDADGSMTSS